MLSLQLYFENSGSISMLKVLSLCHWNWAASIDNVGDKEKSIRQCLFFDCFLVEIKLILFLTALTFQDNIWLSSKLCGSGCF